MIRDAEKTIAQLNERLMLANERADTVQRSQWEQASQEALAALRAANAEPWAPAG